MQSNQNEQEQQKRRQRAFETVKFFSYFDRFDQILVFSRRLIISFFVLNILLVVAVGYFFFEIDKKTKDLTRYVKSTTIYLRQQQILNATTLATRIAADYFSLSYDNFDSIYQELSKLFDLRNRKYLTDHFNDLRFVIEKGHIIQRPIKIYYDQTKASIIEKRINPSKTLKIYRVETKVEYEIRKKDSNKRLIKKALLIVDFVKSEPRLSNPYGLSIYSIRKILLD